MNIKKVLGSGVVAAMMISALAPMGYALAEDQKGTENNSTAFCDKIADVEARLTAKDLKVTAKVDAHRSEMSLKKSQKWSDIDTKRETKRSAMEAKKAERFTKMENRTGLTDAQKAAVLVFEASAKAALDTEKIAVDAAVSAYRATVSKTIADKQILVDTILKTYKDTITAALLKAKTDCAAGVSSVTAKNTFEATKNAAKVKMNTDRAAISSLGEVVGAAAQTRMTAIQAARTVFTNSIKAARAILMQALQS